MFPHQLKWQQFCITLLDLRSWHSYRLAIDNQVFSSSQPKELEFSSCNDLLQIRDSMGKWNRWQNRVQAINRQLNQDNPDCKRKGRRWMVAGAKEKIKDSQGGLKKKRMLKSYIPLDKLNLHLLNQQLSVERDGYLPRIWVHENCWKRYFKVSIKYSKLQLFLDPCRVEPSGRSCWTSRLILSSLITVSSIIKVVYFNKVCKYFLSITYWTRHSTLMPGDWQSSN